MNWGTGITIAIISFMTFIVVLVIGLVTKNVDLEYEDYYVREVSFQDRIEAESNGKQFEKTLRVAILDESVAIMLPDDFTAVQSGEVHFYRPDNAKADIRMELSNDKEQHFPLNLFQSGRYEVRMEWKSGDKPYYLSKSIFIP
jgi:hypothetical protein